MLVNYIYMYIIHTAISVCTSELQWLLSVPARLDFHRLPLRVGLLEVFQELNLPASEKVRRPDIMEWRP